jgi:hypothetical protein
MVQRFVPFGCKTQGKKVQWFALLEVYSSTPNDPIIESKLVEALKV